MTHRYVLALGSNMRVPGVGGPRRVIAAAMAALENEGIAVKAFSPVANTAPLGPSLRRYANAAALVATRHAPLDLLDVLQRMEKAFGRRRWGRRWRARTLDIDIVVWSEGIWRDDRLTIPHPAFRDRDFVLGPAAAIAPSWRDPVSGLTLRHLHARLTRKATLRRCAAGRALSSVGRATDF